MFSRLTLLAVAVFWVTMNVLLWRSEFGGRHHLGAEVSAEMVWQKMLTAPDNSSLEILHHKKKIGFCHWAATYNSDITAGKLNSYDPPPEGMVEGATTYRIDFEGNAMLGDLSNRVRFDFNLRLNTNQIWQEFKLMLNLRPNTLELRSRAVEKAVHVHFEDDASRLDRTIPFADLNNPEKLLREFDVPVAMGMLGGLGLAQPKVSGDPFAPGLHWEAHNDWVNIGHSAVRAYRLETKLIDRYRVVVFVSRVGEILRVELPDELLLINDQLVNL